MEHNNTSPIEWKEFFPNQVFIENNVHYTI